MQHIISINEISHYTTYLIDIVGIISDGKNPYPNAIAAVNKLIQNNKHIIFLSNNPRPSSFVQQKIKCFGLQEPYHIVTSGDLLHHILTTTLKNKKIYHLGRNRQHALLEGMTTCITSSLTDADAILLSCFVEEGENIDQFDDDLRTMMKAQKPVYCPNPDRLTFEGEKLRYPSGYFAYKLEQMGCPVIYLGKPYEDMYLFLMQKYQNIILNKTIMIGDTLETDIYGAINFGIDSLLITNGISGLSYKNNDSYISQSMHKPTYVIKTLLY